MQREVVRGASANAGLIFHVFVQDSSVGTGAGKTGLAYTSFSCRYIRNGETISGAITTQDITTIGTYQAPTANTNIRIKLVDDTNMPGIYEVHLHPDWVNTTNSCQSLTIFLSASGAAVLPLQIPLVGWNPQDSVRGGMTALPNAAPAANGGLPTVNASNQVAGISGDVAGKVLGGGASSITGTGCWADDRDGTAIAKASICTETRLAELDAANLPTDVAGVQTDTNDIQTRLPAALVGGRMDSHVGDMAANVLTAAAINAGAIASGKIGAGAITATEAPNLDAAISTRATPAQAETACNNALATYDPPTSAELVSEINSVQADIAALNNITAAAAGTAAANAILVTPVNKIATDAAGRAAIDLDGSDDIETGLTFKNFFRRAAAALFGKSNGLDLGTPKYRNMADAVDRISATCDANGNRSVVSYNDT